ncbi:MAG: hypothetical protein NVS2B5_23580 [Beijerinckiaceae bacterium]
MTRVGRAAGISQMWFGYILMETPHATPLYETADFQKTSAAGDSISGDATTLWDDVRRHFDAVYCISLKEQPHRADAALQHLREQGLGGGLTFYRPARGLHTPRAIWASHRAVASHALHQGYERVLILEDDVQFRVNNHVMLKRLSRAIARLPEGWWALFLGHFPLQMYFRARGLVRIRSGCTHAYVANRPLLHWLAGTEPMDPEIPVSARIGSSIDAAFANLPGMYALFPMIAFQRFTGDHRIHPTIDARGMRRSIADPARYRRLILFRGMRLAEIGGVLLSPWHWLTLEFFRLRSGRRLTERAHKLRTVQGFDADYYLQTYPDVAASGRVPIEHYLRSGLTEGRKGRPDRPPQAVMREKERTASHNSSKCEMTRSGANSETCRSV